MTLLEFGEEFEPASAVRATIAVEDDQLDAVVIGTIVDWRGCDRRAGWARGHEPERGRCCQNHGQRAEPEEYEAMPHTSTLRRSRCRVQGPWSGSTATPAEVYPASGKYVGGSDDRRCAGGTR